MNPTEPQPDPSPAQREERLTLAQTGLLYVYGDREVAQICPIDGPKWTEQSRADAQRLVNGWNALPLLAEQLEAQAAYDEAEAKHERLWETDKYAPATEQARQELKKAWWRKEKATTKSRVALTAIRESKGN